MFQRLNGLVAHDLPKNTSAPTNVTPPSSHGPPLVDDLVTARKGLSGCVGRGVGAHRTGTSCRLVWGRLRDIAWRARSW